MPRPNLIYIYADDLGRGMLGCYGQKLFQTPNIDRLAREGVRFTSAYGAAICAPARASLMTGMHDAHAGGWTFNRGGIYDCLGDGRLSLEQIYEVVNNCGLRPRAGRQYLAAVARQAGYATGQIGKLEWGFATSDADIRSHGWDYHYGYYDHRQCHGFYPPYVFENGRKIGIEGNTRADFGKGPGKFSEGRVEHDPAGRAVHSQDLYDREILRFIRENRERPFFLYHPSQLPHGPVYFPDVYPQLAKLDGLTGAEQEFASMVLRLDRTVGLILDELERLKLDDNTMIVFSSDNGHAMPYQQSGRCHADMDLQGNRLDQKNSKFHTDTCGDVFNGNDGMAGLKATNFEGGTRIPFLVRWPGHARAGASSSRLIANYDTLATFAEALGVNLAAGSTDGLSFLPELLGRGSAEHAHVVYASHLGPALVTREGWKLRTFADRERILAFSTFGAPLRFLEDAVSCQLYYLPDDYREERDLAAERPDKAAELRGLLLRECDGNFAHGTPEAHFAFYNLNYD